MISPIKACGNPPVVQGDDDLVVVEQKSTLYPPLKNDAPGMSKMRGLMRSARATSGKKLSNVRTVLIANSTDTSSATTAQFPVRAVDPSASAEFTQWAAIYDEYRVLGVEIHVRLSSSAANSGCDWSVSYDPIDVAALATVVSSLESSQHIGPLALPASNTGPSAPSVFTRTGFFTKKFKVPKGTAVGNNGVTGNAWTDTGANPLTFGYIKAAIPALSAGTSTLDMYQKIDVEFRSRQ